MSSDENLLRGNFATRGSVEPEKKPTDARAEYEKKAKESIGGSMVFVERKRLLYDPKTDGKGTFCCAVCLYWHDTREQKDKCMEGHGYETLNVRYGNEKVEE